MIDGRVRTIAYSFEGSKVTAILPHFWDTAGSSILFFSSISPDFLFFHSAAVDPQYSVLVKGADPGGPKTPKPGAKASKGFNVKLVYIVVPIVVGSALAVILFFVFRPKYEQE